MNRGLLIKSLREAWVATVLFGLAMAGFEALIVCVFPRVFLESAFADSVEQLLQLRFVQGILKGLLGTEIGSALGPGTISSIAWVHPIVLALLWAHEITYWTRMPAGEVDRGTIDVLLALPISRTRIYLCETAVWLGAGMTVISLGLAGNQIGGFFVDPEYRAAPGQLVLVVGNLFGLYLAVGGMASLVSALSDRRGRAVGVVFGVVLASFLLNFLAQFWAPAKEVAFLSVLNYYRPLLILRGSSWPLTDLFVLASAGAGFWLAGAIVFARRDICTV